MEDEEAYGPGDSLVEDAGEFFAAAGVAACYYEAVIERRQLGDRSHV